MRELKMLPATSRRRMQSEPLVARSTYWVRAEQSGILRSTAALGTRVRKGEIIGVIADPFGEQEHDVHATNHGIIIGRTNLPLVNEGEALFHIARFESTREAANIVDAFQSDELPLGPALDEEPPIV